MVPRMISRLTAIYEKSNTIPSYQFLSDGLGILQKWWVKPTSIWHTIKSLIEASECAEPRLCIVSALPQNQIIDVFKLH